MKKALLIVLLLSFTARAVCQDTTQLKHTKEYYLEKSARQRKTGWILLGTGAVALTAGILLFEDGYVNLNDGIAFTGIVLTIGGGVGVIFGAASLATAGENKKRAAQVAIVNQNIYLLRQGFVISRSAPALKFTIAFK
jgi:hypothetical protein